MVMETAVALCQEARRVVVLTGAGISAESGVPTFRDAQTGLWAQYDPTELATPEAFHRDPQLVWRWYAWRRELIGRVRPGPGHQALVRWQQHVPELQVVTQNVDGLHQQAGSDRVIELHGSIRRDRCSAGCHSQEASQGDQPPSCPRCAELMRPDVVWFGEALPEEALNGAVKAVGEADLVLSVGTSTLVQPAASLPFAAIERGVPVLEINLEPTPLTSHAISLRGKAGEVLPELVAGFC